MNNNYWFFPVVSIVILSITTLLIGISIGISIGQENTQKSAIMAHCGEYVTVNDEIVFQWKQETEDSVDK